MSFRPFTSESYAQDDRPEAWRDVLAAVGLQPATGHSFFDGHATASHRHAAGVALTRMAAGAQSVAPLSQPNEDLPIALIPVEDGMVLKSAGGHRIVPVGHLVLLPRSGDWSIVFQRDMRAIVLSVTSEALHGRLSGRPRLGEPRVVPPSGFADVFSRLLDATARTLDTLSDAEWNSVAQSLVDLLLTLAHQLAASTSDAGSSATQAALLHSDLPDHRAPARRSRTGAGARRAGRGISERYLQKLFETVGDNFTHYVRERRLQRAWADLSNPTEAHRSISEIAYAYGFGDSAHFSRAFRHRFGLPPREFRQQEAERATLQHGIAGQRGWPQEALAQLRVHSSVGGTQHRCVRRHRGADDHGTQASPSPGRGQPHPLGLFQPLAVAANRDRLGRHHHHRDADAARLRRTRDDDRGRCRC